MRIVIFIDWFAPAYKGGGPIQSIVNLVNYPLPGVEYRIICSNKDLDGVPLAGVGFDQWIQYNEYTKVWYASKNRSVLQVLKMLSRWEPDVYFINGIYSVFYNLLPIVAGKAGRKIISARGMLHPGALSQKSLKKKLYILLWKALGIHRKYLFHATNQEEERFIKSALGQKTTVHVAPNLPRIFHSLAHPEKKANSLLLVSIGLISPMKNYLEVLKALAYCKENIAYTIFGPVKDAVYWQQCKSAIKALPSNIKVEYKGDLPSSAVFEALTRAHVFILPSKSENFGHAIYEAFTAGKPVITSHKTPWNNLEQAKAGFNIDVDKLPELSAAISFFAQADEITLAQWSLGAKAYAEKAIDIQHIQDRYRRMFALPE